MFKFCAYSEKGTGRRKNEDRVMVDQKLMTEKRCFGEREDWFKAVVCDGVGSTGGGDLAAGMIAKGFEDYELSACSPIALSRHIHGLNRVVAEEQARNEQVSDMATTAAGIFMTDGRYLAFNLGDTRIYKYCEGMLTLVTRDHTAIERFGHSGQGRNVITSYIGGNGDACNPSIRRGSAESGSIFLLCSDGVYKGISDEELKDILGSKRTIAQKERAILKRSLQNGSVDDMSLVLVECAA